MAKADDRLGRNITLLRKQLGLSQADLAEKIGVARPSISLIESGSRTPSLHTLRDIAKALNVPVSLLVA